MNRIVTINEVASTNTMMLEQLAANKASWEDGDMLVCYRQTAGRGQRGNSWEAAPDLNIALSLLLCPEHIPARASFIISELFSIAVCNCLEPMLPKGLKIKWPNDIYWEDRKLGGILIENVLSGQKIKQAVCGLGLNVNQTRFLSDAPNPVSMFQISNRNWNLQDLSSALHQSFLEQYHLMESDYSEKTLSKLHKAYLQRLWRIDSWNQYKDAEGLFEGKITDVEPNGLLNIIRKESGELKKYAFKEVSFVI